MVLLFCLNQKPGKNESGSVGYGILAAFRRSIPRHIANPAVGAKAEKGDEHLENLIDPREEKHDWSRNMPHKSTQRTKRDHNQPAADQVDIQHEFDVAGTAVDSLKASGSISRAPDGQRAVKQIFPRQKLDRRRYVIERNRKIPDEIR